MATETSVSFGAFRLDPQNACIWRGEEMIKLTPKAFAVLHYLVANPGRLVTKDELFTAVWPKTVVSDVALSVCVRELRKNLEDDAKTPLYIETVHRQGFRFLAAVAAPVPSSEFKVPSQAEVASWQARATEQEVSSVMPAQAGIQESQAPTSGEPPWIPAFAGMTQPPTPQNRDTSLRPERTLDSRPETPAAAASTRFWSRRKLAWLGVVLLVSTGVFLFYFSSLHIPQSEIRNQGEVASPLPLPDKPSIIVLPFVNMSGDPAQEYFSDGVTEEITATLSRVAGLFVIARTSAFTYKGKAVKVQDISREMGVRYVLEGSVRKTDNQVRITAQLIDATTGYHLWSERYDRPLADVIALQDEIQQKIVLALKVTLTPEEQERFKRAPTNTLEAYDYFLRGAEQFYRSTKEANNQARQRFEKAIELDPQYAGAYAALSATHWVDWFIQWGPEPSLSLEQAFAMAQRAVALDDSLPLAHVVLGQAYLWKRHHEQAVAEAERAIALDPNYAEGYALLGNILIFAGRPQDSVGIVEKAMRLNPHYPAHYLNTLGVAYCNAGRYEEAIATQKRAIVRNPQFVGTHFCLVACYGHLGREEEAQAEAAEVMRINPKFSLEVFQRNVPYKEGAAPKHMGDAQRRVWPK